MAVLGRMQYAPTASSVCMRVKLRIPARSNDDSSLNGTTKFRKNYCGNSSLA